MVFLRKFSVRFSMANRFASCVWPSSLYKKASITGETDERLPTSEKIGDIEDRPERGMLFIIGAPSFPKGTGIKSQTAAKLMVNTADHPSYYDLQIEHNAMPTNFSTK